MTYEIYTVTSLSSTTFITRRKVDTHISRKLSKTKHPRPATVLKIKSFNFVSFVDVTVLGYILLEKVTKHTISGAHTKH